MSIFILEDDVIQAQQMKRLVEEICEKYRLPFDFIEVTSKSENIITNIPKAKYVPIYFLDIEIKREERKGLQVAQEIRKYDTQGIIVFVTTHSEFAPISYQYMVSALTFIDKGLPYEERYKVNNVYFNMKQEISILFRRMTLSLQIVMPLCGFLFMKLNML